MISGKVPASVRRSRQADLRPWRKTPVVRIEPEPRGSRSLLGLVLREHQPRQQPAHGTEPRQRKTIFRVRSRPTLAMPSHRKAKAQGQGAYVPLLTYTFPISGWAQPPHREATKLTQFLAQRRKPIPHPPAQHRRQPHATADKLPSPPADADKLQPPTLTPNAMMTSLCPDGNTVRPINESVPPTVDAVGAHGSLLATGSQRIRLLLAAFALTFAVGGLFSAAAVAAAVTVATGTIAASATGPTPPRTTRPRPSSSRAPSTCTRCSRPPASLASTHP